MAPGKEDESELVQNVGVGDVEVVLEGGYGDIAIELDLVISWMFA